MSEINDLIRKIRGKDSLRKANEKTGISYTYWSILEKGMDPRTKSPIKPSPDTLRAISNGYKYPYAELMKSAGYAGDIKEGDFIIQEGILEDVIKEAEDHYGVSLRDDPVVHSAIRELILSFAKMKKGNQ